MGELSPEFNYAIKKHHENKTPPRPTSRIRDQRFRRRFTARHTHRRFHHQQRRHCFAQKNRLN